MPTNRPIGYQDIPRFVGSTDEEVYYISSDDFLAGMITDADPQNIPANAQQFIKNGAFARNLLFRRNGLSLYSLTKPNSNRVMAVFAFNETTTGINLLRFTTTGIHKATSTGWTAFTGPALVGSSTDYFDFTVADNRGFFANNGANVIMEILPGTSAWAALGNAPKFKYITSYSNRIVGANLMAGTNIPYQVGWSGDLNYPEWNPLTDISAGNTPLVDTPADLSDDITGLFNLGTYMCIPRSRTIWLTSKQPSATNPFYFYPAVPKIGADCPRTIKLATSGLFFYSFGKSEVYYYTPGTYGKDQPKEIGTPIRRYLKSLIDDPANVFATFNSDSGVYTILINSNTDSSCKGFSFNQATNNWVYEEYNNVSCFSDLDYATSTTTINGLLGITNNLFGSINSLGGLVAQSNRFVGFANGDLSIQNSYSGFDTELPNIVLTDNGASFTSYHDSKIIEVPLINEYITKCKVAFKPFTTGLVSLYYSKDDGNTFIKYKDITVSSTMVKKNQIIVGNKFLNTRRFMWRFQSSNCMYSINRFDLEVTRQQNNQGPVSRR